MPSGQYPRVTQTTGKASQSSVEPSAQLIPLQGELVPWWIAKQQESRVAFNQYRESRLLKSDGKIALFERFE